MFAGNEIVQSISVHSFTAPFALVTFFPPNTVWFYSCRLVGGGDCSLCIAQQQPEQNGVSFDCYWCAKTNLCDTDQTCSDRSSDCPAPKLTSVRMCQTYSNSLVIAIPQTSSSSSISSSSSSSLVAFFILIHFSSHLFEHIFLLRCNLLRLVFTNTFPQFVVKRSHALANYATEEESFHQEQKAWLNCPAWSYALVNSSKLIAC